MSVLSKYLCLSLSSLLAWSSYSNDSIKKLEDCPNYLTTPVKVYDYIQKNFRYAFDDEKLDPKHEGDGHPGTNWFQSPIETFTKRKGDCEDFANFAKYNLNVNGYRSVVGAFWQYDITKEAHAVCIFLDKDGFGVVEQRNPGIKPTERFISFYQIGRRIYGRLGRIEIQEEYKGNEENYRTLMRINKNNDFEILWTDFPIHCEQPFEKGFDNNILKKQWFFLTPFDVSYY